jgi:hypothetical protein
VIRWHAGVEDGIAPIDTLGKLQAILRGFAREITLDHLEQARQDILNKARRAAEMAEACATTQSRFQREALEERAKLVLATATTCRRILDDLSDVETAWRAVVASGYPLAGLARLVGRPTNGDLESPVAAALSLEEARQRLDMAVREAKQLLRELSTQPLEAEATIQSGQSLFANLSIVPTG